MRVGKRPEGKLKGIDNNSWHLRSRLSPTSSRILNNSAFFRRVTPSFTVHSCVCISKSVIFIKKNKTTNIHAGPRSHQQSFGILMRRLAANFTWMSLPIILETGLQLLVELIASIRTRTSIVFDDWVLATESVSDPLIWWVSLDPERITCLLLVMTFESKVLLVFVVVLALRMKSNVAWLGDPVGVITNGNWWLKEL